jgi:hypothetical protein
MEEGLTALIMTAASTSETSVNFYETTRRNTSEGCSPREPEILQSRLFTVTTTLERSDGLVPRVPMNASSLIFKTE